MLREFAARLLTPFPRPARRMGFLHEQIAIRARERRQRLAWAPHLTQARAVICEAAERCSKHDLAVVVGAGVCLDIPVRELAQRFKRVVLLDVGFLDRTTIPSVERITFDATGCLQYWHDHPRASDPEQIARTADAGWPSGLAQPDLLISANLLGQLHILPAAWLERHGPLPDGFSDRLALSLAERHVHWLRSHTATRCLIADLAELVLDRNGTLVDEQPLPAAMVSLPAAERTWDWDIAPIPEWVSTHHLRHRV
ncbi:MAG: hypothetical protein AAB263_22270, partial [Planctomycetota bacterium]